MYRLRVALSLVSPGGSNKRCVLAAKAEFTKWESLTHPANWGNTARSGRRAVSTGSALLTSTRSYAETRDAWMRVCRRGELKIAPHCLLEWLGEVSFRFQPDFWNLLKLNCSNCSKWMASDRKHAIIKNIPRHALERTKIAMSTRTKREWRKIMNEGARGGWEGPRSSAESLQLNTFERHIHSLKSSLSLLKRAMSGVDGGVMSARVWKCSAWCTHLARPSAVAPRDAVE